MTLMMTMTTMNDRAEPRIQSDARRVERLLAMLDAKRANGGLNADETKAPRSRRCASTAPGPHRKSSPASMRNKSMACCAVSIASPAPGRPDV